MSIYIIWRESFNVPSHTVTVEVVFVWFSIFLMPTLHLHLQ